MTPNLRRNHFTRAVGKKHPAIYNGLDPASTGVWFSFCLHHEVKFTTLTRNNLKPYCRFEVTSRDITNSIVILGSLVVQFSGVQRLLEKKNIDKFTQNHPPKLQTPQTAHGFLVGGFNPFEKYARQIGNLPQIGVKIKNI